MTREHADLPVPHVLREYALVADGRRGALIGPRGDLVWMCAPSWHDDAVFSGLIGGRGHYSVRPADDWFVWGGYYEESSLIFRSRWVTPTGIVECREALAFPGDEHRAVVLRRVIARDTPVTVEVRLDPRAGFGRSGLRQVSTAEGVVTGRTGPLRLRWQGLPEAAEAKGGGFVGRFELRRGEHRDLVLELSDVALPRELPDADLLWSETAARWERTAADVSSSAAPRDAGLALAVLQGLTSPGGGMVAAATMSLPERAEAGRNYDYRYAWIRDQCYAGIAAASVGPHPLVEGAVSFVSARLLEHGERLVPAYTVDGDPVPDERQLRGTIGYPGGADKIGNWVNGQFQLDALGESLQLLAAAAGTGQMTDDGRRALEVAVAAIASTYDTADAGIWEIQPDWWTHSRLACVAGLRAVARPGLLLTSGRAAECDRLADTILAEVSRRCLSEKGHWRRAPADERVDAALLLPPVRGALPAGDSRTVATYEAVARELMRDGYVYRYRQDGRPLSKAEGAFLLCGFMMSLAALQQGDVVRAARLFERNRAACGSPGLLAEEYDVAQRQLRGNLPQAFVHALLLETSMVLGRRL